MNKKNVTDENKKEKKEYIQVLLRKKQHMNFLLSQWKKKADSAQRKVQKYKMNKKKYSQQLSSIVHGH